MTIVTSYDFESDTWTHHPGDNPARVAFRTAVSEIALKAKATLPDCNGRVDSAVKLVLNGDVELLEGGKAKVGSQSNGTTAYHLVNGECTCKDFAKAPSGWCKHRIAAGLHKRAAALAHAPLDTPATDQAAPPTPPVPSALPVEPVPATHTEAPASVNVRLLIGGRDCQITLRDTDETRLLVRLAAVLAQYPVVQACTTPLGPPAATSAPAVVDGPPPCAIHGTTLKASTKRPGSWYCPVKGDDGKYCQTRWPVKASR
jgi:hypothetical protein